MDPRKCLPYESSVEKAMIFPYVTQGEKEIYAFNRILGIEKREEDERS